jgi:hypothetical protein
MYCNALKGKQNEFWSDTIDSSRYHEFHQKEMLEESEKELPE